jgi:hypothetical protein
MTGGERAGVWRAWGGRSAAPCSLWDWPSVSPLSPGLLSPQPPGGSVPLLEAQGGTAMWAVTEQKSRVSGNSEWHHGEIEAQSLSALDSELISVYMWNEWCWALLRKEGEIRAWARRRSSKMGTRDLGCQIWTEPHFRALPEFSSNVEVWAGSPGNSNICVSIIPR